MDSQLSALIIACAFPPESTVAVHRVVGLCRHLAESGWRVTVIASAPPADAAIDAELLTAVPATVRVVRTPALDLPLIATRIIKGRQQKAGTLAVADRATASHTSDAPITRKRPFRRVLRSALDWISWWLHIPDGRTGWFVPAAWAGLRTSRRRRPDVIFASAPVWTAHLVGAVLSRTFRVPLVVDFRDPWCGSAFKRIPFAAHRAVNRQLESLVVRQATHITCAWDGIRKHLLEHYPDRAEDMTTVWNGYDATLLDLVPRVRLNGETKCLFLHSGSFYGPRSPVPLLQALQLLQQKDPSGGANTKVVFLGAQHYNGQPLQSLIAQYGVENTVGVLPTVPHLESLAMLKGADVALLFGQSGSDALASVPAKTYEYIGLGKPVYAIGSGEEACNLLERGGCRVWRTPADDVDGLATTLATIVKSYDRNELGGGIKRDARERFSRDVMAERLQSVLNGVINDRTRRHTSSRRSFS